MSNGRTLQGFYQERFNADPYALLDYCNPEIADAAASVYINWDSISGQIQLNDKKYRGKIGTSRKSYRGAVAAFGTIKRAASGLEYPHLNFTTKKDGGHTETWDGYKALLDIYEREKGVQLDQQKVSSWKQEQQRKREEREARIAALEAKDKAERAQRAQEHYAYESAFTKQTNTEFSLSNGRLSFIEYLGPEDGDTPYLSRKEIADIAAVVSMKRMRDYSGEFSAIELHDIHGEYKGLQRLYDQFKKQTIAVDDGQFKGAHCIIGDLEDTETAYLVEGFATGASIYLATGVPVIVAVSADNLKVVAADYKRCMSDLSLIDAADNDAWKPDAGNTGLLTALELHKQHNIRATYPTFDHLDDDQLAKKPTDFNDLHCLDGLKAVAKQLKARANKLKYEKKYFEYNLQRLKYTGIKRMTDAALKAVGAGMMLTPSVYTSEEVYRWVINSIPSGVEVNRVQIKRRIKWLAMKKIQKAQAARSFSQEKLNQDHVNYIRLEGEVHESGTTLLPANIFEIVSSLEGMVNLKAGMGAGKTEKLLRLMMAAASKGAYIAHRTSLIGDATTRLSIDNYQNVGALDMPYVSHLGCCVNSIIKPKFHNNDGLNWFNTVDFTGIDEATQVLRHVASDGAITSPTKVMDSLVSAMRSSRQVLLCDADANDSLIEFCEMVRPGEQIHVIEVVGKTSHIRVNHTDNLSAFDMVIEDAKAGKKVFVANDSAENGKELVEALLGAAPDLKVLHVYRDSKADQGVQAFMNDPNSECTNYDVLIFSPAISSGVSITTKHFDSHYGIFHGVVAPADAIQMMRRDRTATEYVLGLGIQNAQYETDREAIFRGLVSADEMTVDYEETDDEIILRRKKTIYDEVCLTTQATENEARNDYANNLLLNLIADGYQVVRLAKDEEQIERAIATKKDAKAMVKLKRYDMVQNQETPNDEDFEKLSRSEMRSQEEAAQIDRYNIENKLCTDVDPLSIDFYDDRGLRKVANMELLQASEEAAESYDRAQMKNGVVITRHNYKKARQTLLAKVFNTLGVDRFTGVGEFSHQECREIMSDLLKDKASIELYNALKIGAYANPRNLPKDATTFVKNIVAKLGLNLRKRKTGGRNKLFICEDTWRQVSGYVLRRADRGVNSLKFQSLDQNVATPVQAQGDTSSDDVEIQHPTSTQTPPAVGYRGGDTLQNKCIESPVKYPCAVELNPEVILAQISNAIADTSLTVEQAREHLSRMDYEDIQTGEITPLQLKHYFQMIARRSA